MVSSVAGASIRLMEKMQLTPLWLGFLLTIPMASYETERTTAMQSWLAILLVIGLNWLAWTLFEGLQAALNGVKPEPLLVENVARVQSTPRFDPTYGFISDAVYNGEIIQVVLDVTSALLSISPTLNQGMTKEMALAASKATTVAPNTEPESLVALYSNDVMVGWGARVRTPLGEDALLTAMHVWDLGPDRMAKRGLSVNLGESQLLYHSHELVLDYALVRLRPACWSSLRVRAAKLVKAGPAALVTVFGGQNTQKILSSRGMASYNGNPLLLSHEASTFPGWSGTPLYHKGMIVGVHLGGSMKDSVPSNRACNVACRYELSSRSITVESSAMSEDSYHRELDRDEWLARMNEGVPYDRFEMDDDVIYYGRRDFYRFQDVSDDDRYRDPKSRRWADYEDDESIGEPIEVFWECPPAFSAKQKTKAKTPTRKSPVEKKVTITQETGVPLNSQGAGCPRGSPPLANLSSSVTMTGITQESDSPVKVCHSDMLETRVASLEKLLASQSQMLSQLLERSSLNFSPSDGRTEDQKPSTARSSSKPPGLREQKLPKNSRKPSKPSANTTRAPDQGNASELSPGTTKSSSSRSARSRSRRKSTGKQAPESRSPTSPHQTGKL